MALEFLLRYHHSTGDADALDMVTQTLDAMARGGMYDQLGGGFHRYSVDERWLVPHFEKMLYDNAQLARVYLHAWQVTGNEFFRTIVEEILDYVVREMTDPAGGFYSTQDADSEGEEGKFFVWTPDEIREVLGRRGRAFMAAYGVTDGATLRARTSSSSWATWTSARPWPRPGASSSRSASSASIRGATKGADLVERPDAGRLCRSGAGSGARRLSRGRGTECRVSAARTEDRRTVVCCAPGKRARPS